MVLSKSNKSVKKIKSAGKPFFEEKVEQIKGKIVMDNDEYEAFDEEVEEEVTQEKQKKSGVLYFSSIPPRFTPARLQAYFEQYAPGLIGRKNKFSKSLDNRYTEGWLEIKRKILAKRIANVVDNKSVGGKKRDPASGALWNIKYLSGFKWVHLIEQLEYEKTAHNRKMTAEVNQARRIAAHFEEQIEKGENLKRLETKVLKQGGNWEKFQRQIAQRETLKQKKKGTKKITQKEDEMMKMIFAE